ncbi:MAG: gamma-glutamyltransferase [Myxococcales bacterium]|nr:MAG: gamma-glutamyltransferase [Myxococcales bacterium]
MPSSAFLRLGLYLALAISLSCGSASQPQSKTTAKQSPQQPQTQVEKSYQHFGDFEEFAVAADEPQASAAGASILAKGGNAADAAAATMLALGVTSFASSGLGGGGFALYYRAKDRSVTFIDFRETAPAAATEDMYQKTSKTVSTERMNSASEYGGLAVGVPGEPAGIEAILTRFGSLSRKEVAAPAISLAKDGFVISERIAEYSEWFPQDLARDPGFASLLSGKKKFEAGEQLKRPELAKTLELYAEQGPKAYYQGEIGKAIVEAVTKNGGVMTLKDLESYTIKDRKPLQGERFGYRWVTAPPPSAGGYTMLASMALLEQWQSKETKPSESWLLHAFSEAFKGPFADRVRYFGDPDKVKVPVQELLAPKRLQARASLFDANHARPQESYDLPLKNIESKRSKQRTGGGTSHFCVVDKEGNVASVTTTVNLPFGARITAAGLVLNDQMDDFASGVDMPNAFGLPGGHPNLPGPNKRPISSMTPTIVFEGDEPVLCVGGSGGSRIITAVTQSAYRALVQDLPPREAVEHPRIHDQGDPDTLKYEKLSPIAKQELKARGHELSELSYSAVVQMIRIRDESPRIEAASDPRKGGAPAGR